MEQLNNSNNSNSTNGGFPLDYQITLVTMYTVVLVGGIISIALMINILKSNVQSVTTMAVLNLIVVHLLFLLTVPFRIYFFVTGLWKLTWSFCKVVSGMVHAHMYIAFIFYVVILVIRYLSFFRGRDRVEFHRRVHALFASLTIWAIVLIVVLPIFAVTYGASEDVNDNTCFSFAGELENSAVATLNYLVIAVVVLITLLLTGCQSNYP
ncbi:hypothetical protein AAFF_G00291810 [Aldrovandia affinis]|uniref:G-protein coupled receptors family 1 profile domain-containing protein n=1 Tax=Aldrovandia affinis TaxID=143900 RepID=A0AAD7WS08_9TELE|nr:hypothetical protein AAFF_G00291810 [Aldrovandia affinis]